MPRRLVTLSLCLLLVAAPACRGDDRAPDAIGSPSPSPTRTLEDDFATAPPPVTPAPPTGASSVPATVEPDECIEDTQVRKTRYRVVVEKGLATTVPEVVRLLASTYCDERGWTRSGVSGFAYDPEGGLLISLLGRAGAKRRCEALLGQRVSGNYSCASHPAQEIVLNWDRWSGGAPPGGFDGSIDDYRRMVANHEMGHALDLRHQGCTADGEKAPVMMQQSISMTQGGRTCVENPWPLDDEIERLRARWSRSS